MNIFNHSHSLCVVPSCFKSSVIVPVPKKCKVTCLNYCCPLLYSLCTHDCVPAQKFSLVIKFADNTMVIGLITNSDEMAYRAEISALAQWIQENNLSLNIDKNKELIVDYRKKDGLHDSISISGTTVEMVTSQRPLEFTSPTTSYGMDPFAAWLRRPSSIVSISGSSRSLV